MSWRLSLFCLASAFLGIGCGVAVAQGAESVPAAFAWLEAGEVFLAGLVALAVAGVALQKGWDVGGSIVWAFAGDRVTSKITEMTADIQDAVQQEHQDRDGDRAALNERVGTLEEQAEVLTRQLEGDPATRALGLFSRLGRLEERMAEDASTEVAHHQEVLIELRRIRALGERPRGA